MSNTDWTCPFCNRHATITGQSQRDIGGLFTIENADGPRVLVCHFVVCPNPKCKKFTLSVSLYEAIMERPTSDWKAGLLTNTWMLIPNSLAKSFPAYIPEPILADYNEACLIQNLSPKASATLSRRCLQGIIRDFWKVNPGRLVDEIAEIKDKIDALTWKAIEAVRTVGNIGAHMEADINLIVDVDPNEAELLIGLIEMLLKEWYIAREDRTTRLNSLVELAAKKENVKKQNKP
jgi:hypothetical protein